jgi:hypothetical protein
MHNYEKHMRAYFKTPQVFQLTEAPKHPSGYFPCSSKNRFSGAVKYACLLSR